MYAPCEFLLVALKCALCYVEGPLAYCLTLYNTFSTCFTAYIDVDWVGCPDTCRARIPGCWRYTHRHNKLVTKLINTLAY